MVQTALTEPKTVSRPESIETRTRDQDFTSQRKITRRKTRGSCALLVDTTAKPLLCKESPHHFLQQFAALPTTFNHLKNNFAS